MNRYFAYSALANREMAACVEQVLRNSQGSDDQLASVKVSVSDEYVKLHSKILFDESMSPSTRQIMVNVDEATTGRPDLAHHYWYEVREEQLMRNDRQAGAWEREMTHRSREPHHQPISSSPPPPPFFRIRQAHLLRQERAARERLRGAQGRDCGAL